MIYFIINYILNDTVHISDPFCVIFKKFCLIVINYFILTELIFRGLGINRILPLKNLCTHLQADNPVLVMPRGPLDILNKVLGMHVQVVTKPSLATSGQLTIMHFPYHIHSQGSELNYNCSIKWNICLGFHGKRLIDDWMWMLAWVSRILG